MFALATPLLPGKLAFLVLGLLILIFGLLQNFAGFALRNPDASGSWFSRGGASILTGLLLMAMPNLTFAALAMLLGLSWMVERRIRGCRGHSSARGRLALVCDRRRRERRARCGDRRAMADQRDRFGRSLRRPAVHIGWLVPARGSPQVDSANGDRDGRPASRTARSGLLRIRTSTSFATSLTIEEAIRSRSDRGWCWLFLLTFFAIHAARMDIDWNLVGMLSPAGAVLGDVFLAILLAYGIVAPLSVTWRSMTRPIERRDLDLVPGPRGPRQHDRLSFAPRAVGG